MPRALSLDDPPAPMAPSCLARSGEIGIADSHFAWRVSRSDVVLALRVRIRPCAIVQVPQQNGAMPVDSAPARHVHGEERPIGVAGRSVLT